MNAGWQPRQADAVLPLAAVFAARPTEGPTWQEVREDFEVSHPGLLEALTDDILEQGVLEPVQLSADRSVLIKGHHRVLAAQLAGLTEIPVVFDDENAPEAWVWNPQTRAHELYDCECGTPGCTIIHED